MQILMGDDIVPGADPSYELAKSIFLYHPLGSKIAESPVVMAQSQEREITVAGAPDRVVQAFVEESKNLGEIGSNKIARNHMSQSRVYGITTLALLVEGPGGKPEPSKTPFDPWKLGDKQRGITFNVFDPLNTAGSLVLNQQPNSFDFQKPRGPIIVAGQPYHRTRVRVLMHESPIYIAYSTPAFGFTGRSVYQRCLYPLKSFIRSMITDEMILRKAGLLIAKMKQPGPVVTQLMQHQMGLKREILKAGETNDVLGIGIEESIDSLNLQNIDGAGGFARTNVLKNIATAADMPAFFLENETLVAGFGEGTEDARNIARYVDSVREEMCPTYDFLDEVTMYRAWNPDFYKTIQRQFPDQYSNKDYQTAFYEWKNDFSASWPSLLIEPDSERVKTDDVKLKAAIALAQILLAQPTIDPDNKMEVMRFLQDSINESKNLFPSGLQLDFDAMRDFMEEQEAKQEQMQAQMGGGGGGLEQEEEKLEPKAAPPFSMRDAQKFVAHLGNGSIKDRGAKLLEVVRSHG
jgi:Protein of unknown function (DUF1073)